MNTIAGLKVDGNRHALAALSAQPPTIRSRDHCATPNIGQATSYGTSVIATTTTFSLLGTFTLFTIFPLFRLKAYPYR
jgi:hypothetical protein